jgi:hypothetical protein
MISVQFKLAITQLRAYSCLKYAILATATFPA